MVFWGSIGPDCVLTLQIFGIRPRKCCKVAQERLGHKDITTTMNIYAHVLPGSAREAAEKIGQLVYKDQAVWRAGEVVMFAMLCFWAVDGEGTANTDHQTRNSKEGLAVSELIPDLRLPPRAPKRKDIQTDVLSFWCAMKFACGKWSTPAGVWSTLRVWSVLRTWGQILLHSEATSCPKDTSYCVSNTSFL